MRDRNSMEQAQAQPGLLYADQQMAYNLALRLLRDQTATLHVLRAGVRHIQTARRVPAGRDFRLWFLSLIVALCRDRQHSPSTTCTETSHASRSVPPNVRSRPSVSRQELLEWGFGQLPFEQRVVLLLHDVHGCTYEEVAHIVGLRVDAVGSRLALARRALRDFLEKQGAL